MKLLRIALAAFTLAAVGGFAITAADSASQAERMADAAKKLLAALNPELKKKASFGFDDPERLNWHFVPRQDDKLRTPTRQGVRAGELGESQRKAMLDLLRTGTSESGFTQATTIMGLEAILAEIEQTGKMVRDPGWYFVSIFGTPGNTGSWGWRVEGHHLSLNFRVDNGEVTSATPFMFGANPAELKFGPKKGFRTLPEVEDLAVELFTSLDPEQKKVALQEKQFADVDEIPAAKVGTPVGIPASKLTDAQQATLDKLITAYANRMPADMAKAELAKVKAAGRDAVFFGFAGGTQSGQPRTYRVQGPTFLIEFLNVQADGSGNPANHIHSVWRTLPIDFGQKQG